MNRVLVVIDVQRGFVQDIDKNRKSFVDTVRQLVRKRVRRQGHILGVHFNPTYNGDLRNFFSIRSRRYHPVEKWGQDGSLEILSELETLGLPGKLDICGVFTSACVYNTVKGLVENGIQQGRLESVRVLFDACADWYNSEAFQVKRYRDGFERWPIELINKNW